MEETVGVWSVRDARRTAYPFSDSTCARNQLGSHATLAFRWGVCVCVCLVAGFANIFYSSFTHH